MKLLFEGRYKFYLMTVVNYFEINWCHLKITVCQSNFRKQEFKRIFEKKIQTNGNCLNKRNLTKKSL